MKHSEYKTGHKKDKVWQDIGDKLRRKSKYISKQFIYFYPIKIVHFTIKLFQQNGEFLPKIQFFSPGKTRFMLK